jgi:hypothetical protein
MRITLVQTKLFWENPAQNLAQLEEKLAPLAGKTDLILLPEMFTTGFTMKAITFAETERNTTYKWLKLQSAKLDSAIVGSFIFRKNNKYFNRLVFITPDGGYSDWRARIKRTPRAINGSLLNGVAGEFVLKFVTICGFQRFHEIKLGEMAMICYFMLPIGRSRASNIGRLCSKHVRLKTKVSSLASILLEPTEISMNIRAIR